MKVYIVYTGINKSTPKPYRSQVYSSMEKVHEVFQQAYVCWLNDHRKHISNKTVSFEEWLTQPHPHRRAVPSVYESTLDEPVVLPGEFKNRISFKDLNENFISLTLGTAK